MDRVFLDCNIIIDWLTDRKPFSLYAIELISLIENKKITGYISPLVLANSYYLLKKHFSEKIAYQFIIDLKKIFKILDITEKVTSLAVDNRYKDFEDDLHYYTALKNDVKYIITRNKKDFISKNMNILTAEEYLIKYRKQNHSLKK